MFKSNRELSYIDQITLMNTIKELAMNDLQLKNREIPFLLETNLPFRIYGKTVKYLYADGTTGIGYIAINYATSIHEMINTIFHELKHAQQIESKPLYYRISSKIQEKLIKLNIYNGSFYFFSMHEISARRYARKAMKKYKDELEKILKLSDEKKLSENLY